jgi:hypothetical protein
MKSVLLAISRLSKGSPAIVEAFLDVETSDIADNFAFFSPRNGWFHERRGLQGVHCAADAPGYGKAG